jgi:Tfp pilus assembly protein PilP
MRAIAMALLFVSISPAGVGAQTPSPRPPAPSAPAAAQPPSATPPPPESYTYSADGRRDPFMNLLGTGAEPRLSGNRREGPAGMNVGEIAVSGIVQSRGALIAMVQGPDKKTYIMHAGDKFLDGTIKSITPQGLVIIQEVNDPLSLVKQREIHKLLRSLEDAKG